MTAHRTAYVHRCGDCPWRAPPNGGDWTWCDWLDERAGKLGCAPPDNCPLREGPLLVKLCESSSRHTCE